MPISDIAVPRAIGTNLQQYHPESICPTPGQQQAAPRAAGLRNRIEELRRLPTSDLS
jgi:hypothetical protein